MTATTTTRARGARTLAAVALLVVAGCGADDAGSPESGSDVASAGAATSTDGPAPVDTGSATAAAMVAVADTALGPVLVDGDGATLYVFDNDGVDTSACSDECLDAWPPVLAEDVQAGEGVTAELGTFTREDGGVQATVNGLPLYRFASDTGPGDAQGQGVGGVWWVVDAAGAAVTEAAGSSATEDAGTEATEATEATYGATTY